MLFVQFLHIDYCYSHWKMSNIHYIACSCNYHFINLQTILSK